MKIIGINNNYHTEEKSPALFLMADSSLLKDGKPFFLPSFDNDFRMYPSVVIKICRLGKNIAKRFASRYYDAYTFGINVRAEEMLSTLKSQQLPWDSAVAFDSSAIMGDFKEIASQEELFDKSFDVRQNEEIVATWSFNHLSHDIDALIESISNRFTLKIGDLIYIGFPTDGFKCNINYTITVSDREGNTLLNFKIK